MYTKFRLGWVNPEAASGHAQALDIETFLGGIDFKVAGLGWVAPEALGHGGNFGPDLGLYAITVSLKAPHGGSSTQNVVSWVWNAISSRLLLCLLLWKACTSVGNTKIVEHVEWTIIIEVPPCKCYSWAGLGLLPDPAGANAIQSPLIRVGEDDLEAVVNVIRDNGLIGVLVQLDNVRLLVDVVASK